MTMVNPELPVCNGISARNVVMKQKKWLLLDRSLISHIAAFYTKLSRA